MNKKKNEDTVEFSEEDKQMIEAYNLSLSYKGADTDLIFALIYKIHKEQPPGGILIFLPGYEDIMTLKEQILRDENFGNAGKFNLFCLHSNMQVRFISS